MLIVETRKENGERYLPITIHVLFSGLLRHMREVNVKFPNFLYTSDSNLKWLLFIGRHVKHAQVLSGEDE